jgi:hypothetical protein
VRRCPVASHPQYTGILLAVFGQITRWPTIITLALFPVIALDYVRLALSEEKDMIDRFASFQKGYMQRGPRFSRGEADDIKSPHKRGSISCGVIVSPWLQASTTPAEKPVWLRRAY